MLSKLRISLILSLLVIGGILGYVLNGQEAQEGPQPGGTLRLRTFSPVLAPSLDPAFPDEEATTVITDQIFEGLIRLDSNLQVVPELAEYWVISPDGTKYTFYLKKGIRFHHGSHLTAKDVKTSLERLIQPGGGAFYQYFIPRVTGAKEFYEGKATEVKGFVARDNYVFEIQLEEPYLSLLSVLAAPFCKILPADLLQAQGRKFFFKPSGTGPFKFAYWLRDSRLNVIGVRLERNENYYAHKPFLEAIEFSANFSLDQFLDQDIDIIPYYSRSLSRADCQVLESDSFRLIYLGFSCHRPPLDNQLVRRAVALALDKRDLVRAYFTFEAMPQILNNVIHPRLPGFFPLEVKEERNVLEAKMLLEKALVTPTENLPPIDFCVLKSDRWRGERLYQRLREQLAEIGLSLRLKIISSYAATAGLKGPYLVLLTWSLDFPDPENIIRPLFSAGSELNRHLLHYESQRLENLLSRSEKEKSWSRRNEIFREMEAWLLEDLPVIPLFLLNQRLAVQRYVHGLKVPALGFSFLDMSRVWKGEEK
jgi:ABC-type transport system substrate-binding protein